MTRLSENERGVHRRILCEDFSPGNCVSQRILDINTNISAFVSLRRNSDLFKKVMIIYGSFTIWLFGKVAFVRESQLFSDSIVFRKIVLALKSVLTIFV